MNHGSKRHPSCCHGVTSLEYVILVAVIAVAVAGAMTRLEVKLPGFFQKMAYSLGAAPGPGEGGGSNPDTGNPGTGNPGGGTPGGGTPGDGTPGDGGTDPGAGNPGTGAPGSGDPGAGGEGGDNPGGGAPGGGSGADDFVPDYTFSRVIPYYWNTDFQDWFARPSGIPEEQWHDQPYTITSNGDAVAVTNGNKPNEMGWNGVTLRFTTPAPGQTLNVRLTVGQNKILYTFTRATSP